MLASLPEHDDLDLQLLAALQRNARSTYAELGALVGLKPPAVHERVRRLESRGYLRGYSAVVDAKRLGWALTAFVSAYTTAEATYDGFAGSIASLPEVVEIHSVAGEETFVLKVVARSTSHLDDLLNRLARIRGIARTKTTIVLSTAFERSVALLEGPAPEAAAS